MENLSYSFRTVTQLLEPLRTGNQPSFLLGLWHAPGTLIAISLIAGEILAYGVVNL